MVYFLWNGAVILFWVGLHGALLVRGWLGFVGRVVCGVVFIVCWYNVSQFVFNIYGCVGGRDDCIVRLWFVSCFPCVGWYCGCRCWDWFLCFWWQWRGWCCLGMLLSWCILLLCESLMFLIVLPNIFVSLTADVRMGYVFSVMLHNCIFGAFHFITCGY